MLEQRLLERIRSRKMEPERRESSSLTRTTRSVLEHLMRILNTWQGNVPIAPDYGIPDFIDLLQTYPESVRDIERSMRLVISRYEPRLSAVRVTFLPSDEQSFRLRFQITAKLKQDQEKTPVYIETEIDSDGKVNVRI